MKEPREWPRSRLTLTRCGCSLSYRCFSLLRHAYERCSLCEPRASAEPQPPPISIIAPALLQIFGCAGTCTGSENKVHEDLRLPLGIRRNVPAGRARPWQGFSDLDRPLPRDGVVLPIHAPEQLPVMAWREVPVSYFSRALTRPQSHRQEVECNIRLCATRPKPCFGDDRR